MTSWTELEASMAKPVARVAITSLWSPKIDSAWQAACQALSIFGDHSDVMATRATGFAMLASNSVQEVMDFAMIAQAATLEARVPFVHFFDGFRTSHEVAKVEQLTEDDMRAMMGQNFVEAHRARALSPDHPVMRGTAQNPDV